MIHKLLDETYWEELETLINNYMGRDHLVVSLIGTKEFVLTEILNALSTRDPWLLIKSDYNEGVGAKEVIEYMDRDIRDIKKALINRFLFSLDLYELPKEFIEEVKETLNKEQNVNRLFLCYKESGRSQDKILATLEKHFSLEADLDA